MVKEDILKAVVTRMQLILKHLIFETGEGEADTTLLELLYDQLCDKKDAETWATERLGSAHILGHENEEEVHALLRTLQKIYTNEKVQKANGNPSITLKIQET